MYVPTATYPYLPHSSPTFPFKPSSLATSSFFSGVLENSLTNDVKCCELYCLGAALKACAEVLTVTLLRAADDPIFLKPLIMSKRRKTQKNATTSLLRRIQKAIAFSARLGVVAGLTSYEWVQVQILKTFATRSVEMLFYYSVSEYLFSMLQCESTMMCTFYFSSRNVFIWERRGTQLLHVACKFTIFAAWVLCPVYGCIGLGIGKIKKIKTQKKKKTKKKMCA